VNNQEVDNEKLIEKYRPTDSVVLHIQNTVQQVRECAGTMLTQLMA